MFTKRHEQELAEIKALTYEIGQRFEEVLKELEGIKRAQDQLGSQESATAGTGDAGRSEVEATDGGAPESEAAGAGKKARRQAAPVAVAAGAKSGKRRNKAGSGGGEGRKRGAGRKKRQASDDAPSPGTEEE
jgi:hypothetical protein